MAKLLCRLLPILALGVAGSAEALRCGNRIVSTGDWDFQVRERCGEPAWTDTYSELLVSGIDGPIERRVERVHDEWFYNFGPRSLVRRLVFVDGRLARIETGGYGVREIGTDCSDTALRRGSRLGEIYLRCGAPESRNRRYEDVVQRDGLGRAQVRPIRREEWLYALPGSRFMRLLVFHDGRLDRVERISR